jgi:hypothetical protein
MTGKREKAARKCRDCIEKHPDEKKTFLELLTEIIKGLSVG